MSVSVGAIRGGWGGLRPVLSLENLRIADRGGKAAFELQRAEATLSWWTLFAGQLRFHDLDFYRPHLELRRGADGLIYLADKPINAAGKTDDGRFTEWLLAQPRLGVHDATLVWRDDFLGSPEVQLTAVEIAVEKHLGRHSAALAAMPPRPLAGRIDLRADVELVRREQNWTANGTAYAETHDADLGVLRRHIPIPETLRSGLGSVRVWAKFSPEYVEEVVADVSMRHAKAQLAADVLPLELASLSGRATYRAHADGFSFETQGLRFMLANGLEARPGRFSITRTAEPSKVPRLEVRADGIDLKIASALVDYFPLPREVKNHVARFAPRGSIREAMLAWSDDGARAFAVKGRFEDLSFNAVDAIPGVDGFDGSIEGSERGGTLVLATRKATVDLAQVFRDPLVFDELDLRARWRPLAGGPLGRGLEVAIEEARFSNADAAGEASGTWRSLPDAHRRTPGLIDLKGRFTRAKATSVPRYLPSRIAATRDWLERAVEAGDSGNVRWELKGDLFEFPFGEGSNGRFVIESEIRGGKLRYHPDWPTVDAIDGSFRMENRHIEIRADRAAIYTSKVRSASATLDLAVRPIPLVVQGDVETTGAETTRFLRESPLASGPGAFTRAVAVDGPGRLKLRLDLPLGALEGTRVAGEYTLINSTASVARNLVMRELNGRVAFSERGVRAQEVAGTLFGQPATLSMASAAEGVVTTLEGRVDAPVLASYIPEAFASRLAGTTTWKARVVSGRGGTDVAIDSDLRGIASSLPAPLAKPANDAMPLAVQLTRLGSDQEQARAMLGEVHGRFNRAPGTERWQAAIRFGAPLSSEPARDGVWLYGKLAALDADAWQAAFASPTSPATPAPANPGEERTTLELRGLDLQLGRAHFLGRDFRDLSARLSRDGVRWGGRVESPLIAGEVSWNPEGRGSAVAKLERLAIPEPAARPAGATPLEAKDLPAIDVTAERFDFRGRELGRLLLKADNADGEWRIDRLDLTAPYGTMRSSGVWRRTGAGSLSTLDLKVDAANLNTFLTAFGYGDYMRGSGQLQATLAWPGSPTEFALGALSGTMRVDARHGQFAKIQPGAGGKLLGLLSLQTLSRRATGDFQDVFSEGFAFERIHGEVKVARGILLTDGFEISGAAAFVSLAGEVSLPSETQSLTLRVVPEVGESMALAATVLGTPVLGLSTLLVSKLLNNPFGKVVAYEYLVTGSWDNPVVTRTSAPPAGGRPAPQASAAAP